MSTMTELGKRVAAQSHDITHVSVDSAGNPIISGGEQAKRSYLRKTVHVVLAAEVAATDYTLECLPVPADLFPGGAKVVAIKFRTSAAVSESATLFNTYTFVSRDVNGVNNLTSATMTTDLVANGGIGTTVAHKEYAATLSATLANLVIPAGGVLVCVRTHASTGTAVPYGSAFTVELEAL
jgi:hypothetical protein